jgi:hypothetical protein
MTLLQELVHDNQTLEGLDLVCQYWLSPQAVPYRCRGVVVPRVNDTLLSVSGDLPWAYF